VGAPKWWVFGRGVSDIYQCDHLGKPQEPLGSEFINYVACSNHGGDSQSKVADAEKMIEKTDTDAKLNLEKSHPITGQHKR
jgi:hypothetical protein